MSLLLMKRRKRNLLTKNQSDIETDLTGLSGSRENETLIRDTSTYWHGSASLKVTTPGSLDMEGMSTFYSMCPVATSASYTGSIYVKGSGNLQLVLDEYDSNYNWLRGTRADFTATGTFNRQSASLITGLGTTKICLRVRTTSQQAVIFWVDGLQLEQNNVATSWKPGI